MSKVPDGLLTNLQTILKSPLKFTTLLVGLRLVRLEYQSLTIQSEGSRWLWMLLCFVVLHSGKTSCQIWGFHSFNAEDFSFVVCVWLYSGSFTHPKVLLLTFRGPCIVIYSCNESQRDALFLKFILVMNSTYFGQIYCLLSADSQHK